MVQRGLNQALSRLDAIAARLDPRLAITTTPQASAAVLAPTAATSSTIQNEPVTSQTRATQPAMLMPTAPVSVTTGNEIISVPAADTPVPTIPSTSSPIARLTSTIGLIEEKTSTLTVAAPTLTVAPPTLTLSETSTVSITALLPLTQSAIVSASALLLPSPTPSGVLVVKASAALSETTPVTTTALLPEPTATTPATATSLPTLSPTSLPALPTQLTYEVKSGDTMVAIARRYNVSLDELLAANGIPPSDSVLIRPGQVLLIPTGNRSLSEPALALEVNQPTPAPQTYVIQPGDILERIARQYGVTVDALLIANNLSNRDATRLRPGQTLVIPGGVLPSPTPLPPPATATAIIAATATLTQTLPTATPALSFRLDPPRLRSPENGVTISCSASNRLIWEAPAFIRSADRFWLHLGYVNGSDANGNDVVVWVLQQERPSSDASWEMDVNYCDMAPQAGARRWRWYVEIVDPLAGNAAVSPPSAMWSFVWQ